MTSSHSWFRSGEYSILAHFDCPAAAAFNIGVLIVPPFGWEDVCSYRPLREFARTLAAQGIPTLRFDLPATADSSGTHQDSGLVAAWIQSISDATQELRRVSGVTDVAVVGIRLGSMLAVAAAAAEAQLQDLVLWGPYASGRSMIRELRAFRNMEVPEYSNGEETPRQPLAGLETAGYLITPEMQSALEALDLTKLPPMPGRRVLMLSRDELPCDAKLQASLSTAGCRVDTQPGHGFNGLMNLPHEVVAPVETFHRIYEWLVADRQRTASKAVANVISSHHAAAAGVRESVCLIPRLSGNNFAILTEPLNNTIDTSATDCCMLFLNPGAARHTGPNRMWVDAARRWAAKGLPAVRLDLGGIGESDGEQNLDVSGLYQEHLVDQVEQAMDFLSSRIGAKRFIVVGLCSGAFLAFHVAARKSSICGAILINPRLFVWDPEVDRRRDLRRTSDGFRNVDTWRRFLHGQVQVKRLKQAASHIFSGLQTHSHLQIPAEEFNNALTKVARNGSRLTMVFTEGEPLLRELEEEGHLPPAGARDPFQCIRIANGGHTFRPLWAQKVVHDLIDQEVAALLGVSPR